MTRPAARLPQRFWPVFGAILLAPLLLHVASGTPLWSEVGPLSVAQALLLGLLSVPCAALSLQFERVGRMRLLWGAAAAALASVSLVQLGILTFEALPERPVFEYPALVAWGAAAMTLVLMRRLGSSFVSGRAFILGGFALQSLAVLADFADGGGFGLTLVSLRLLGAADELIEMLVLAAYLTGLTLVAADMIAGATRSRPRSMGGALLAAFSPSRACVDRWLARGEATALPLAPAATFLHAVYRHTRWRRDCFSLGERARLFGEILCWPLIVAAMSVRVTLVNGRAIARRTGKSVIDQLVEQLLLAFEHSITPRVYYAFELYRAERRSRAGEYLQRFETKRGVYRLIKRGGGAAAGAGAPSPLNDKAAFIDWCTKHAVPVVPYVLVLENGAHARSATSRGTLPRADLFVKPNRGKGGRGAETWSWRGDGSYAGSNGSVLTEDALLARLADLGRSAGLLVQPSVRNHALLADLSLDALTTVRVVICRNERGAFEPTCAALRVARVPRKVVDNFHAGGLAARVDMQTGVLGRATDMGVRPEVGWWDRHPANGAPITGRRLPCWAEALALVRRAHAAFPGRTFIGWDIAFLDEGWHVVEGNAAPDLDIIQRTHEAPLGNARLGQLLAFHAAAVLRAERNAGAAAPFPAP